MEEIYSVDEIRDEIINFKNDPSTQKLENLYYSKSYSEILGVSRREMSHSAFIAWLLNNTESHNLGDFAIRKFLDIVFKYSNKQIKSNTDVYTSIITDNYKIVRADVEVEKAIAKVGRLDIYVELVILISGVQRDVKLIIENKVGSTESNNQTQKYFEYYNELLKENEIIIYVYLSNGLMKMM